MNSDMNSDMQIVRRALSGDQAAYTTLYRNNYPTVISVLRKRIFNESEVEDLAQESFTQAFIKLHQYKGKAKFSTWLYRIVWNTLCMYSRVDKNRMSSQLIDVDLFHEYYPVEDKRLKGVLDRIELKKAIKRLAPRRQEVFVLHDILGYTHEECSKIFNVSVGANKSTGNKARENLRVWLQ